MDLVNVNANEMSAGQLKTAEEKLEGFMTDATRKMNSGESVSFGSSFTSDFMNSKFAGGMSGGISNGAFPSSGAAVNSLFTPLVTGRRRDPMFGQELSRGELLREQKQMQRAASYFHMRGFLPPDKGDGTFKKVDDLFRGANGQRIIGDPKAPLPGVVYTREMLLNLNLVPQVIKNNLDSVASVAGKPQMSTIIHTLNSGEEVGTSMFLNQSGSVRETIVEVSRAAARIEALDDPSPAQGKPKPMADRMKMN